MVADSFLEGTQDAMGKAPYTGETLAGIAAPEQS